MTVFNPIDERFEDGVDRRISGVGRCLHGCLLQYDFPSGLQSAHLRSQRFYAQICHKRSSRHRQRQVREGKDILGNVIEIYFPLTLLSAFALAD